MTVTSKILTCIDAGVLITATRGSHKAAQALHVLADPNREFASSFYIQLEVLPKAVYHKRKDEAAFYRRFFQAVTHWAEPADILDDAFKLASAHGLAALDALHLQAALSVSADEFITSEGATKPLHRVRGINIFTL